MRITEIRNSLPSRIVIGAGSSEKIAEELRDSITLIITDRGVLAAGLTDKLTRHIQKFDLFADISAEPTTDDLDKALAVVNKGNYDAIVGIGGGSVLDVAKAVTALDKSVLSAREALAGKDIRDPATLKRQTPPYFVAMPTTAGTGSESTLNAIFIDSGDGVKKAIISEACLPRAAVLDPELTVSLPAGLTASTGTDALCHCVESLISVNANPISETYSIRGIGLIEQNLTEAVKSPQNIEARRNMLTASFLGGAALAIAGTTAVHALAYPLGKRGVPHGIANSMLFIPVMSFNLDACRKKLASLATVEKNAEQVMRRFEEMLASLPLPSTVSDFSISISELDILAEEALKQTRLLNNNPKPLSLEDIKNIYAQIL